MIVNTLPELDKWHYLGDGLYVAFDGYQLMLRANDHSQGPTMYLEPQVLGSLNDYAARIWGRKT